jgi:hypothetical protein
MPKRPPPDQTLYEALSIPGASLAVIAAGVLFGAFLAFLIRDLDDTKLQAIALQVIGASVTLLALSVPAAALAEQVVARKLQLVYVTRTEDNEGDLTRDLDYLRKARIYLAPCLRSAAGSIVALLLCAVGSALPEGSVLVSLVPHPSIAGQPLPNLRPLLVGAGLSALVASCFCLLPTAWWMFKLYTLKAAEEDLQQRLDTVRSKTEATATRAPVVVAQPPPESQ